MFRAYHTIRGYSQMEGEGRGQKEGGLSPGTLPHRPSLRRRSGAGCRGCPTAMGTAVRSPWAHEARRVAAAGHALGGVTAGSTFFYSVVLGSPSFFLMSLRCVVVLCICRELFVSCFCFAKSRKGRLNAPHLETIRCFPPFFSIGEMLP